MWRKPKFEAKAWVSIEASHQIHVDEFLSIAYQFKNFLSIATGNEVTILDIIGQREKAEVFENIQIFHQIGERLSTQKLFSEHFFPFNYPLISEHIETYLQNWYNLAKNLEPTYDLYFGTIYNPYLYPTHEFLSFAQGLESYCSKKFENNILPDKLFTKLLSKILEIVNELPEKFQKQLTPKAQYELNRKSFRTKLKKLFKEQGNLFKFFIADPNDFIRKVVDTRNYYTHYSPTLEDRAVKVNNIPFLSQELRYVLIAILLKETGLDDSMIKNALRRYYQFRIRPIN
jgi:hypothetical protein